jgi:hypothetical protein
LIPDRPQRRPSLWAMRSPDRSVALPSMSPARVFIVLAVTVLLIPAAALAHRGASRAERSAILAAVVRQRQLSRPQAACQVVTISTVNQSYASLRWPTKLSTACSHVAANGVIIEHRTGRGWLFVVVGSTFKCPIQRVPNRVAHDLGVCT